MRSAQPKRKKGVSFSLSLLLGLLLLGLLGVDLITRPVIETITAHQVKVYAMRIINDAMYGELQEDPVAYGDLVTVLQNGEGNITSIQSNMIRINRLKARMTSRVLEELQKPVNSAIRVNLGTLSGSHFFTGRGLEIEIKLSPAGHMASQLYHEFVSAGINQTLHRIVLEVAVEIDAVFPGYRVKTETVTNYVIAETVIVGDIPEGYVQISGLDLSSLVPGAEAP